MSHPVELRGVSTRFGHTWVHRRIDLAVPSGEVVALVGGSGTGKTTLLRQMVGLLQPAEGEVRLFGEPLFGGSRADQLARRRRFGMLFQQGALFSALNVFANVAFPLREAGIDDEGLLRDLVLLKLAMVELGPDVALRMPAELSGGMVKRVALARALALEPEPQCRLRAPHPQPPRGPRPDGHPGHPRSRYPGGPGHPGGRAVRRAYTRLWPPRRDHACAGPIHPAFLPWRAQ